MKHRLKLETWNRREHFEFFSRFREPFFNITFPVAVGAARAYARARDIPFSLHCLYQSILASNAVEPFRYRLEVGEVWCYDRILGSCTIGRTDGTFGFAFFEWERGWDDFLIAAQAEISRVQVTPGLAMLPAHHREDTIHYSILPWLPFTSIQHPRTFDPDDSIPKITFGAISGPAGAETMPVSVHAHHGLMDAWHVAQYRSHFQAFLDQPGA